MFKKITLIGVMLLSIPWLAAQNVGIGTATPAAKLDVQGNGISYDVLNVSNNSGTITDRVMVFSDQGNLGIGVPVPGPYKLVTHGLFPTAFSPQVEFWNGDPNLSPSVMLADINDAGGSNGVLNLYSLGSRNATLRALGNSYLNGGNLGIGIGMGATPPNEILHLGGAMVLGQSSAPVPLPGTIHYNPSAGGFFGYDGAIWKMLDLQQDGDWGMVAGIGSLPILYNIFPGPVAVSFPGYVPPITPADYGFLYVNNNMPPGAGVYSHQLLLDDITGNFDASHGYLITNWQQTGINQQFSQGIYNPDASFKITRSGALTGTAQSDGVTMTRFNQTGIVDFPNQSRVRAFQEDATGLYQLIPSGQWTPVNFTIDLQPPFGYDEHSEFTVAPSINSVAPPEQAYFTAAEAGYYQVNARCEFNVDEYYEDDLGQWMLVQVNPDSYVSIAIYAGPSPGLTVPYAQGNNLQIGYMYMYEHAMLVLVGNPPEYMLEYMMNEEISKLKNNNAPNVSDVVYLQAGDIISIWVFHTAATPMNLNYVDPVTGMITGNSQIYVSIHKVS
ncbi:MAG: hypothetical protein K0B08_06875 [Bacteroidales bacterium]|nr:hypothetical protein [Bacteroidales bacterium]